MNDRRSIGNLKVSAPSPRTPEKEPLQMPSNDPFKEASKNRLSTGTLVALQWHGCPSDALGLSSPIHHNIILRLMILLSYYYVFRPPQCHRINPYRSKRQQALACPVKFARLLGSRVRRHLGANEITCPSSHCGLDTCLSVLVCLHFSYDVRFNGV